MSKVFTVVVFMLFSSLSFASSKGQSPIFKQLKKDMLIHGLDFKYVHGSKKSLTDQLPSEEQSNYPVSGVFPEEISEVLKSI
ncbi:MAG: hypothetical protein CME69_08890 [Halobacteriovorax sp.]|nr:hypothetical protein [Halobacteriovorax sp.]|tara:strand:+ start:1746 stop:1991 length:246 start_codon:yes stop_codon:yes gene_type:complete